MRERIFQLLPTIRVLGVPCVPKTEMDSESNSYPTASTSTPRKTACVLNDMGHLEHLKQTSVPLCQHNQINEITHGTPRTPNFPEMYEERAAIMEYDGGLIKDKAEQLAYTDIMERTENE